MAAPSSAAVLDCSRPAVCVFWLVVGSGFTLLAMRAQGAENWASLLRVGSSNPARARIERELGPVISPDAVGHDGQIYYLIARDPFAAGTTVQDLQKFDNNPPRYRYRRILYPLLAGGFGQFGGRTTLVGLIALAVFGIGLGTAAIADLAYQLRVSAGTVALAAANIGALVSAMILTADALALGLALAGIAFAVRERLAPAVGAFILATLTKEVFLIVPLTAAGWLWYAGHRRRHVMPTALLPLIALGLWSGWVALVVPDVATATSHLVFPMTGIVNSSDRWVHPGELGGVQLVIAVYVLVGFSTAGIMCFTGRNGLLRSILAGWLMLGCMSSSAVWNVPSNVARAFSIVWPVAFLLLAERIKREH